MKPKSNFTLIFSLFSLSFLISFHSLSAQSENIKFEKLIHNFGDFLLSSGAKSYTFKFTNVGTKPLLIQSVISSCGCASPQWTKSPVEPGKSGSVTVTYLNNQGPYPFDKALTVYVTGEKRPIVLRIKGIVHEKEKSLDELFPIKFGSLAFKKSYVEFGLTPKGKLYSETIEVANSGKSTIEVGFTTSHKGVSIEAQPSRIAPKSKAVLNIKLNANQIEEWGEIEIASKVIINGREVANKPFRVTATLTENFDNLTPAERERAPIPMARKSNWNFGTVKKGDSVTYSFNIQNVGKSEWRVRSLYSKNSSLKYSYPSSLAPSKSGSFTITLDTSKESVGDKMIVVSIVSNSPVRPVMNLVVQGTITP